ncbi:MAG: type IV pilus modification protein PilV [Nevskiaceae bacterium]|nr:MAG: type IV pilus modification protein PilV [Nevskiaceae bacterium]TAM23161.1 MAG: type IV pilus modification protein PilV [Nevskiaceae bacterium]
MYPGPSRRQRGVGLIEVLVALLILSIGLLGISLVQARALSSNNSSMGRSMAVVASYSILEAMRADRADALGGAYNQTVTADDDCTIGSTTALATVQLAGWCAELRATLGAATTTTGTVACDGAGDCTITILFDDSRIGAGGSDTMQVLTRAML